MRSPVLEKRTHALIRALRDVRTANPTGFQQVSAGLHAVLDPELTVILRTPSEFIQCAQGRGQVAQELLAIIDRLDDWAHELERAEKMSKVGSVPPAGAKF